MEQENTDLNFADAIRRVDNQEFTQLMKLLHHRLAVLAANLLPPTHDPKDALSAGWMKLYEQMQKEKVENPEAFMRRVVRNYCLDESRRYSAGNQRLSGDLEIEGTVDDPDKRLLYAELLYCIEATIDSMPELWQKAFRLHVLEKMKAEDVAAILHLHEKTVRKYADEVREKIRTDLLRQRYDLALIFFLLKLLS